MKITITFSNMGSIITNIVPDGNKLRVFISIDGAEESRLFEPSAEVVNEIKAWAAERAQFYKSLAEQAEALKAQLEGLEID